MTPPIRRLRRKDIDDARWDATVSANQRGFPYGLCWWLDAVTEGRWEGLVLGDYQVILPIPFFKKIGPLALINGAAFTQHFGPFGEGSKTDTEVLLAAIPSSYLIRKLALLQHVPIQRFSTISRTNYELRLYEGYDSIAAGYHKNLKRKLRRKGPLSLEIIPAHFLIKFHCMHMKVKLNLADKHVRIIQRLLAKNEQFGNGECYCVRATESSEILAALFLARKNNRIINLLTTSSPEGLKSNAMAFLLDAIIQKYAGQEVIFDFDGSDIPGVATFYRGFGAEKLQYFQYQDKRIATLRLT